MPGVYFLPENVAERCCNKSQDKHCEVNVTKRGRISTGPSFPSVAESLTVLQSKFSPSSS